jgi:hypothetical protein
MALLDDEPVRETPPIMLAFKLVDLDPEDWFAVMYSMLITDPELYRELLGLMTVFARRAAQGCLDGGRGFKACSKFFAKQAKMLEKTATHAWLKGDVPMDKFDELVGRDVEEDTIEEVTREGTEEFGALMLILAGDKGIDVEALVDDEVEVLEF